MPRSHKQNKNHQQKKSHHKSHQQAGFDLPKAVGDATHKVFDTLGNVGKFGKKVGRRGLQGIHRIGTTTTRFGEQAVRTSLSAVRALGRETSKGVRRLSPSIAKSMRRRAKQGGSHQKKQLSLNSAVKLLRNYYSSKYSH